VDLGRVQFLQLGDFHHVLSDFDANRLELVVVGVWGGLGAHQLFVLRHDLHQNKNQSNVYDDSKRDYTL
jgi:hypothetical protein